MNARWSRIRNVVLLTVIGGVVIWRFGPWHGKVDPNRILASGTIEATEIIISPKIAGRISVLHVDEGSVVATGAPIADIETTELTPQVKQAEAALAHATDQWDAAKNGNRPEQIAEARAQLAQAEATVSGAFMAVINARADYSKVTELKAAVDAAKTHLEAMAAARTQTDEGLRLTLEGNRKKQIDQARAAVTQSQVQLDQNNRDASRMQTLYKTGAISRQQWEDTRTARDTAASLLDQSKAHLADLVAGARPQEIRQGEMAVNQADANLEGAKLALDNAETQYRDRLDSKAKLDAAEAAYKAAQAQRKAQKAVLDLMLAGTRPEDLRAAADAVRQAKAALDLAHAQIANAVISSPAAGVIKTKSCEIGEVLAVGAPIVTLDVLDHVWLRVYVPEDQYGRVKIGQTVSVTVDSYARQTFHGVVAEIASDAEFTPKSVQTAEERVKLVYGIKVDLDNRDHRLKPGMPADAVFNTRPSAK